MSGVLTMMSGLSRPPLKAEFIGVTVIGGNGNGTAVLPTGTQVGDYIFAFAPYNSTVSGGGTGAWTNDSYSDKHGYTKLCAHKRIQTLGNVSFNSPNYGPTILAVYRGPTYVRLISKPEDNTNVLPLTHLSGRLSKTLGMMSVFSDRSGNGDATPPTGWTERTGPNANGTFTGELADNLNLATIPETAFSTSWTNVSTTSSYYQSGFFYELTAFANATEYDAAFNAAIEARAAANVIARMTVQPDDTRKALIAATIDSLRTAGVWAKLDAFYCMAAHNTQAARLNWVKPEFDLVNANTNVPTFTANQGITTNGTDNGLDTVFTPSTHAVKMTANSASMFLRHRTNTQNSYHDAGWSFTANPALLINTRNGANQATYSVNSNYSTPGATTGTITDARKVYAINRANSTTQELYIDGVTAHTYNTNSTGLMSAGSIKIGLTLGNRFSGRQFSFFGFGAALTATEHQALRDAIENYMTAVGA